MTLADTSVPGLDEALKLLSGHGPWFLLAGLLGVVLIWKLPEILGAAGETWKVITTTRQKLNQNQQAET